jgi:hypothetical protein
LIQKYYLIKKIDDHHIIPKAYLNDKFSEEELEYIDCVVNRTLIPKITNIKIGKKAPDVYMNELYKENDKFTESLKSHLIPVDVMDGIYNEFFDEFIKDRSKIIFKELSENIINKQHEIVKLYYEVKKKSFGKNIDIFCDYRKNRITASFNRETQEILWNGKKYTSVSTAANAVKKSISGKDMSTNGWVFWKYKDAENENFIEDLRY